MEVTLLGLDYLQAVSSCLALYFLDLLFLALLIIFASPLSHVAKPHYTLLIFIFITASPNYSLVTQ